MKPGGLSAVTVVSYRRLRRQLEDHQDDGQHAQHDRHPGVADGDATLVLNRDGRGHGIGLGREDASNAADGVSDIHGLCDHREEDIGHEREPGLLASQIADDEEGEIGNRGVDQHLAIGQPDHRHEEGCPGPADRPFGEAGSLRSMASTVGSNLCLLRPTKATTMAPLTGTVAPAAAREGVACRGCTATGTPRRPNDGEELKLDTSLSKMRRTCWHGRIKTNSRTLVDRPFSFSCRQHSSGSGRARQAGFVSQAVFSSSKFAACPANNPRLPSAGSIAPSQFTLNRSRVPPSSSAIKS